MGEIQGFVTRSLGAPRFRMGGVSAGVLPVGLTNQFTASRRDGTVIGGGFGSARAAMLAVENAVGGGLLKWARADFNNIEHYRGERLAFWPGDLGDLLEGGGFWRADIGLRLVPTGPAPLTTQQVTRWAARLPPASQIASSSTLLAAPLYADASAITTTTGRPALRFSGGDAMSTTLVALVPPYTFFFGVTYRVAAPARREVIFERDDGGNYRIGVTAAGNWHMVTPDGGTILGPAAQDGETAVIHFEQSSAGLEVFLNGVSFGTSPLVPGAQTFSFSSLATAEDWEGDIFDILFLARIPNVALRTTILNYYFGYYGIEP